MLTSSGDIGGAKPSTRYVIEKSEMRYEELSVGGDQTLAEFCNMTHQQVPGAKDESVDSQAAKRILVQTLIVTDEVQQRGGNHHV